MVNETLLTPKQAAAQIGGVVSSESLRRWAKAKRIPHVRLASGAIRFRPTDLDGIAVRVEPDEQGAA